MSWDYSSVMESTPAAPVVEPAPQAPASDTPGVLTREELEKIAATPEKQAEIANILQQAQEQGLTPEQLAVQVREAMGWENTAPLTNDLQPTDQSMMNNAGVAQNANTMGFSSYTQEDLGQKQMQARQVAESMLARGASEEEILAEVGKLAGPEFAQAAQDAAQGPIDAQKFTLASGMPEPTQAAASLTLGSLLGGAESPAPDAPLMASQPLTQAPQAERPYGITTDPLPVVDMGATTAALAAIGNFMPQPDLPNLVAGRGKGQALA